MVGLELSSPRQKFFKQLSGALRSLAVAAEEPSVSWNRSASAYGRLSALAQRRRIALSLRAERDRKLAVARKQRQVGRQGAG
jgi:hypothetical protein